MGLRKIATWWQRNVLESTPGNCSDKEGLLCTQMPRAEPVNRGSSSICRDIVAGRSLSLGPWWDWQRCWGQAVTVVTAPGQTGCASHWCGRLFSVSLNATGDLATRPPRGR